MSTTLRRILGGYGHLYSISGIFAGALALGWHPWQAGPTALLIALVLAVTSGICTRIEFEFQFGGDAISVSPAVVATVLTAVLLDPQIAMLVAMTEALALRGLPARILFLEIGSLIATVGATSFIVHAALGSLDGPEVVVAGVLGAFMFQLLHVSWGLAMLESQEAGAAAEHIRDSAVVSGFELFLPTMGVAVAAPFGDSPVQLALAVGAFQGATVLSLRVMKSEQVHREQSVFLRSTFSRYVPASVVDQLTDEQASTSLGGEEREITVMFVDVRNFTGWSERLAPAAVVSELNDLMTRLTDAVFATGGTLDKFTGDGLMAFWGAPVEQPDHAARACNAARLMLAATERFNEEKSAGGGHELRIGVGIHTGRAIVGNIGHVDRMDYTAIGDTVNVTARLEAATKQVGCDALASGATANKLIGQPEFEWLERVGDISVKGRSEPVESWVLTAGPASAELVEGATGEDLQPAA